MIAILSAWLAFLLVLNRIGITLTCNTAVILKVKVLSRFVAPVHTDITLGRVQFSVSSAICADNCAISRTLLARGATIWARVTGKLGIVEPLTLGAGAVEGAFFAIVNWVKLGLTFRANCLLVLTAVRAVLAEGRARETFANLLHICHGMIGETKCACSVACTVLTAIATVYIITSK